MSPSYQVGGYRHCDVGDKMVLVSLLISRTIIIIIIIIIINYVIID